MISLTFLRVTPESFAAIRRTPALLDSVLNHDAADHRKVMKQLAMTHSDAEPFDIDEDELDAAIRALGGDELSASRIALAPAAVQKVKLPDVFGEHDIEKLFKNAAKRGDHVIVDIERPVEEVREAAVAIAAPKDRAALLAMLAKKPTQDELARMRKAGLDLTDVVLAGETLKDAFLWNANLTRADLSRCKLVRCALRGANLDGANLKGATLDGTALDDARLQRADLSDATLKDCRLYKTDFTGITAPRLTVSTYGLQFQVKFCDADLRDAKLKKAALDNCDFRNAKLAGAVMAGSQLTDSKFEGCDLSRADLTGAQLQNSRLKGALLDGAKLKGAQYTKKTTWPGEPPAGTVLVKK